jgi:hypothetical protein
MSETHAARTVEPQALVTGRRGGVGGKRALHRRVEAAGAATALVAPGFRYHANGPIIASPEVRATFWGPLWRRPDHAARRANLIQFLQDMLASRYMNILSQYGVGHGAGQSGRYLGDSNFTPGYAGWEVLDDNAATVQIVADGNELYQRHNSGRIWHYTGTPLTGWQELDNNPATVQIAASSGHLYQRHNTGRIWIYTGTPHTGWLELDNNPATVDIVADGNELYQRHNSGRIWRYTGTPHTGWQELDNNPATVQIAANGGELFQLHGTGMSWRYTGTPHTGWEELGWFADTKRIVAAGHRLIQLQNAGRIWRYGP